MPVAGAVARLGRAVAVIADASSTPRRHAILIPAAALTTAIIAVGGQPVYQPGFASISILLGSSAFPLVAELPSLFDFPQFRTQNRCARLLELLYVKPALPAPPGRSLDTVIIGPAIDQFQPRSLERACVLGCDGKAACCCPPQDTQRSSDRYCAMRTRTPTKATIDLAVAQAMDVLVLSMSASSSAT
jgi:hypothetical protein